MLYYTLLYCNSILRCSTLSSVVKAQWKVSVISIISEPCHRSSSIQEEVSLHCTALHWLSISEWIDWVWRDAASWWRLAALHYSKAALQAGAFHCTAMQWSIVHCSAFQYITMQCIALLYRTAQEHNTVWWIPASTWPGTWSLQKTNIHQNDETPQNYDPL